MISGSRIKQVAAGLAAAWVALAPFCVSAQEANRVPSPSQASSAASIRDQLMTAADLKSESYSSLRVAFRLASFTTDKLLLSGGGGGGVADGGGGNLVAGRGELLDLAIHAQLKPIAENELREILERIHAPRLRALDTALPGFQKWLEGGLKKSWFFSEGSFDASKCAAAVPGVCQTEDAVHLNRASFQVATDSARAFTVLTQLLSTHLIASGRGIETELANRLAQKIAKANVPPQEVLQALVKGDLLHSAEQGESTRASLVAQYDAALRKLREASFESFLDACQRLPMDLSRSFADSVWQYVETVKLCAPWVRPERDGSACSLEPLAELIVRFNQSSCARTPFDPNLTSRR